MEIIPEDAIAQAARDSEMRRLVQERVALWRHARKCQRRQLIMQFRGVPCTHRNCSDMDSLLEHIRFCQDRQVRRHCPEPHCLSTRNIIRHWLDCGDYGCPFCGPCLIAETKPIPSFDPERHLKDWHQSVPVDHRRHLVELLRKAMYRQPLQVHDVEHEAYYQKANTVSEYYHLIAEHMWKMERHNEEIQRRVQLYRPEQ